MNKRGWLKIFEAVLAIILILGALLIIYLDRQKVIKEETYIADWQIEILSRLADSDDLRNAVITENNTKLHEFIEANILPSLNYTLRNCNITGLPGYCSMDSSLYSGGDVFVQERIISGTLEEYNPRRLRFFVWRVG